MSSALLNGLIDYRDTLLKHLQQMQDEFEKVNREWRTFEMVYHGDAAYEFKNLWTRTNSNFQDYLERSRRIIQVLDERIAFLQDANRSG